MMFLSRFFVFLLAFGIFITPASSEEKDFFQNIKGKWSGAGKIVAGKFKGTHFTCFFDGDLPQSLMGMSIDGNCRVGLFTQKMNASVTKTGSNYKGTFLNGAKGEGLDIVSARFLKGQQAFVMDLRRKKLKGAMRAQLMKQDNLNISISVLVNNKYIPVIGLDLKRRG